MSSVTLSQETRRKISEKNKGKVVSDETREKISESIRGENHYLYGQHLSDEVKSKMSRSHIGKCYITDDGRRRISEYAKAHRASQSTRELLMISNGNRLKKVSAAYKEYKLNGGSMKWNEFQKNFSYDENNSKSGSS